MFPVLLQISVWNIEGWEKHRSRFLEIPDKKKPVALLDTHIQFHQDQTQFLAVNERHLTIYEARNLECLKEVIVFFKQVFSICLSVVYIIENLVYLMLPGGTRRSCTNLPSNLLM